MILTYGQYKGSDISEVPDQYLQWLIESAQKTIEDVTKELDKRKKERVPDLTKLDSMSSDDLRETALNLVNQMKRNGLA